MTARGASYWLACVLALPSWDHVARAQGTGGADLGKSAVSGQDASDTIKDRAARLHLAMACRNEFDFAQRFLVQSRSYRNNKAPDPAIGNWPVTLMIGKAARLIDQSANPVPCESGLFENWASLTIKGTFMTKPDGTPELPSDTVNRVYRELYDTVLDDHGNPILDSNGNPIPIGGEFACASVASEGSLGVRLILSNACLARQIRAVMKDPGHGPWEWKDGVVTPKLPGTSAGKLPCLSEFKLPLQKSFPFVGFDASVKGIDGDWDQDVLEYTRLTSLLYRYSDISELTNGDVKAALASLNFRFLTLRSGPDGATARELFNLVTSCGNLPNQFGSAIDTVNGTGADPGVDRYSDAAKDAVGKKSFWDSLWRFLKAIIVVAAILTAAALVSIVAGAILAGLAQLAGAVQLAVALAVVLFVAIGITGLFGGIEESENHLLMQNTARYIKNKLMMAELSGQDQRRGFDKIAALNEDVRNWLFDRLQRIAREDFIEYNAKPYNRLSHASILNLLDYACDVSWTYEFSPDILDSDRACDDKDLAVVKSAASVMDLSAAKTAIGSLEGRRLIPYRRLVPENARFYNGRHLLELFQGTDNQLAALQMWTGQMRHAPGGVALPKTFDELEWYSTSQYRPDPLILDIAVNKTVPREQQYRHYTRERYASGNGWLITAGGTDERQAQGFRSPLGFTIYVGVPNDRGVGVPTTLITSAQIVTPAGDRAGRDQVQQFLRFDGNTKDWGVEPGENGQPDTPRLSYSDNNCVAGSFACGLMLKLPSDFDPVKCRAKEIAANFFVVDSTKCVSFNDGDLLSANDIFIAIFQGLRGWGFFEVAQQTAYGGSAAAFAADIAINNKGRFDQWNSADSGDTVEYFAPTQGRLLKFVPKSEAFGADRRACGVVNHESGARFTISNVPASQAGACLSVGPRIFIDLNNTMNPIRQGEGGLTLEQFGR